jgi:putative transposase
MAKSTDPFRYFDSSPEIIRRRERAMERFRRMKTLQKFAAVHGTVHNHFNQERHLISRDLYRQRRSAALAEWQAVMG